MVLGDCFRVAAFYLLGHCKDADRPLLVHGVIRGLYDDAVVLRRDLRICHAWVEQGGKVYDLSNGRVWVGPILKFYMRNNVEPRRCRYYTPEGAGELMQASGIFGPWDSHLRATARAELR